MTDDQIDAAFSDDFLKSYESLALDTFRFHLVAKVRDLLSAETQQMVKLETCKECGSPTYAYFRALGGSCCVQCEHHQACEHFERAEKAEAETQQIREERDRAFAEAQHVADKWQRAGQGWVQHREQLVAETQALREALEKLSPLLGQLRLVRYRFEEFREYGPDVETREKGEAGRRQMSELIEAVERLRTGEEERGR